MSEEVNKEFEEIREIVDEAKAPGTFNIINVLKERSMPETKVVVYLDEQTAYEITKLNEEIEDANVEDGTQDKLMDERDALKEKLAKSKFIFYISGISEGKRKDLLREATKKYPVEYLRELDPMTGKFDKEEKESPERDELFTDFLWESAIVKIEDADGNVHQTPSYSDIREMRNSLPLSAMAKITDGIEKVRIATALFLAEVNEDFLAKP